MIKFIDTNPVQEAHAEREYRVLARFPGASKICAGKFTESMPRPAADEQAWSALVADYIANERDEDDDLANVPRKKQPTWVKLATEIDPASEGDR